MVDFINVIFVFKGAKMSIKKHIPNTITCGNLLCGCLAIVQVFNNNLVGAAYFVGIALVLDFFDGFAARMLKVSSAIGKDLDSLADMVTFGVVPGAMIFKLLGNANALLVVDGRAASGWTIYLPPFEWTQYLGFVITIFSCIRLAKFNNDTRQSDSFIGLPTPANTMIICSFPLILEFQSHFVGLANLINNSFFLVGLSFLTSFLLVAEMPLFALKFKNFSWASNKLVYCFLAVSVIMLLTLNFVAIPLVILLYILLSVLNNSFFRKKIIS